MNKTLAIASTALIIALCGLFFPNVTERVVETVSLGASGSGQNTGFTQFFDGGLVDGSGCFSTTTSGVIPVNQLDKNHCINIASTTPQAVISLTLPATTSMSGVLGKSEGACRTWYIDNTNVAAATTTTLVKGTGWDIMGLDATGAGTGADVIDGNETAFFTACRQKDGDIIGFVHEYIHAD